MTKDALIRMKPASRTDWLESAQIVLLTDAHKRLKDIAAGRAEHADEALACIQRSRARKDNRS